MDLTGLKDSFDREHGLIGHRFGENFRDPFSEELFGRQARLIIGRRYELQNRAFAVEFKDHIWNSIQKGAGPCFTAPYGLFRFLESRKIKLTPPYADKMFIFYEANRAIQEINRLSSACDFSGLPIAGTISFFY